MLPFSIMTFWSLTQALSTFRRVLVARSTPMLTASSKLWSDVALNSVTLATVIDAPFFLFPRIFYPLRWTYKRLAVGTRRRRERRGYRVALSRTSLVGAGEPPDGSTVTATASAPLMEPSMGVAASPSLRGWKSP